MKKNRYLISIASVLLLVPFVVGYLGAGLPQTPPFPGYTCRSWGVTPHVIVGLPEWLRTEFRGEKCTHVPTLAVNDAGVFYDAAYCRCVR